MAQFPSRIPNFLQVIIMKILFYVFLALFIVVMAPFCSIWALNTLFPVLAIPYTFDTWLASLLLSGAVGGSGLRFNRS
jgi:hypothetical protein